MSDSLLKELLKKFNLLSYNYRETILNTWKKYNAVGAKPKTFEEDLEDDDKEYTDQELKEFENLFIEADSDLDFSPESSDTESVISTSSSKPKKLIIIKKKPDKASSSDIEV